MKKVIFLFSCFLFLILVGCGDKRESERMFYVHSLGIDYQDDEYIVHAQIISLSNVAKSEEPRSDIEQFEIVTAKGKSLDQAVYRLYRSVDQYIYWGDLTYLVVSEETLKKEKLNLVIEVIVRFIDTRYQVLVYSTSEDVKEILVTSPIIHSSLVLSKLSDPENTYEQDSYVKSVSVRELIIGLTEPSYEVTIPAVVLVDNRETQKGKQKAVTLDGVGIVTATGFNGTVKNNKANGLKWMNNKAKSGAITILYNPDDPKSITEILLNNIKVKIKPIVNRGEITFDIQVKVDAYVDSLNQTVQVDKLKKRIAKEIKQEIITTYEVGLELNTDIFRLSEHAYRKEFSAWEQVEEDGKVPLDKSTLDNLRVKVKKLKMGKKELTPSIRRK